MDDSRSLLVVQLAGEFIQLIRDMDPSWTKAFFRYCQDGSRLGSNASYISKSESKLIDPLLHNAALVKLNAISEGLLESMGQDQAVILLAVDSNFDYDVKFEYADMEKWRISKLDGENGIPDGL